MQDLGTSKIVATISWERGAGLGGKKKREAGSRRRRRRKSRGDSGRDVWRGK